MRYLFPAFLSILLVSISAWAGTWRDDFNDGDLNGWRMTKGIWEGKLMPNKGNWHVENGVVIGGEEAADTWHALSVSEGGSWSDYTAEVSVRISKPLQDWQMVTLYVSPEEGRSSGLALRDVLGGMFAEAFTYTHVPAVMNPIQRKPFKMETDRWYRLKIKIEEKIDDEKGVVQCFIDDVPILQFQGYRKGAPGFSVYQTVAMFDDFVVTGSDIPDRGLGAKGVSPKGKLATIWAGLKR
jgi:hypothetical protein